MTLVLQKQAAYKVPFRDYHSHAELEEEFSFLAREFSQIAELFSIGRSVEGREILALKISSDVSSRPLLKPQVKFTANIHGNEVVGRELLIALGKANSEMIELMIVMIVFSQVRSVSPLWL